MGSETFCADASLAGQEPLLGTAAEASTWLLLEHDGPWGAKGADDSGLPEAVLAQLKAFERAVRGSRVQLARRPDAAADRLHVWLASTRQGGESLSELTLGSLSELASIDLEAWSHGIMPANARRVDEPMYFVCVHGKRDRCCAMRGMPVYAALDRLTGQRTWMTTHLGGHRFAATLLVLPHGIAYGRVEADEAQALVNAHARGEIYALARVRGRTSFPGPVQAADVVLRERLGEKRIAQLEHLRSESTPEGERVTFTDVSSGSEHELRVTQRQLLPIMQSCGAEAKPAKRYVVV